MAGTSPAMTGKEMRFSFLRPAQQMVGDDAQLDLGGALEDLRQPRVAAMARDRVRLGVPGAAVDLQRLAGDALGHFAGEQLDHRGFLVAALLLVDLIADVIHQLARRLDLGRHLRELEPDRLELGDRLAELHALLRVFDGVLEPAAGEPDRARRGMPARLLQPLRHGVERAAFLAYQAFASNPAIVERELEGLPAEIADLRYRIALAPFRQRAARLLDQEGAQAEMPAMIVGRLGGARHEHDVIGPARKRAPQFADVEHPELPV